MREGRGGGESLSSKDYERDNETKDFHEGSKRVIETCKRARACESYRPRTDENSYSISHTEKLIDTTADEIAQDLRTKEKISK